jgi:putative membrane protein insertion efficiency factor
MLFAVQTYRVAFSPFLGGMCRFHPSCSRYAAEAIARHGAWHGGALAVRRLLRCRPFSARGYDPVPESAVSESLERRA